MPASCAKGSLDPTRSLSKFSCACIRVRLQNILCRNGPLFTSLAQKLSAFKALNMEQGVTRITGSNKLPYEEKVAAVKGSCPFIRLTHSLPQSKRAVMCRFTSFILSWVRWPTKTCRRRSRISFMMCHSRWKRSPSFLCQIHNETRVIKGATLTNFPALTWLCS